MKVILTVVGKDQIGIIAGVCNRLADLNINVLDISQTILQGYFTMMMMVDISACTQGFDEVVAALREYGEGRGLTIRLQRTDIFDAMHTV